MIFICRLVSLLAGFLLELIVGWHRALPHPIMGIGKLIAASEKILRRIFAKTEKGERAAGIVMAAVLPCVSFALAFGALYMLYKVNVYLGAAVESLMCMSIFAAGSLRDAAYEVYNALENDGLEAGRKAVGMIVGRDTGELSRTGVIKAAVETVAENLSDGVIAPMLFVLIGGAPFGYFYKTVNTMDSMVGYKNERYVFFGTGAARLDDFCNYAPSRLSALFMLLCASACGADGKNARRVFKRDRRNHPSPNSGQTEAAMAGALKIQLGGDAVYFGELHKKKTMGDAEREPEPGDIKSAVRIMLASSLLSAAVMSLLLSLTAQI